ncbi:LysM peptidoglycan-binding domain-containing protein [Methylophilus methylotrophus]|uniref:LysM peptidoglycan-binding domain-containing protein n=1 Tax=Methylophilus methylotrophus TaxID=17 RepID=UPI000F5B1A82|nr:LysM peptidoglycan-binding domain-containing protein [Methylophilus methylotrophus]
MNNVTRELRRGTDNTAASTISGQVETDDQITTYTYGVGGRLISEKDATNAEIQYEYDLNGNITKQTLKDRRTADQVINNQAGADDITTYTYDSLNRQTKTTDLGTTVVQEVQYNSFNQITQKRTYTTNITPTTWDEYSQYDRAGRVWKSNSGDGVTKVYINDKNGNATATISGTLNMSNMTLTQVLAQKQLDTQNNVAQKTMYTFSVYDKRSQLITTMQPSMEREDNLVAAGSAEIISGYSIVGSMYYDSSNGPPLLPDPYYPWIENATYTLSNLPDGALWGTGNLRLVVEWYNLPNSSLPSRPAQTFFYNNPPLVFSINTIHGPASYTPKISIYKSVAGLGEVQIVANLALPTPTSVGATTNFSSNVPIKKLAFNNQPPSTSKLLLSYRIAGSQDAYTTVSVPQMVNTSGTLMAGMYAFDWSGLSGNYEFQYVALDNSGKILNQQGGNFNTTIPGAPTVTPQTSLNIGGVGRAFFNTTSISGMSSGLQLINQGADAASVAMRYRLKGSSNVWSPTSTTFVASSAFGVGSFVLDHAGLGAMVNGNDYDIEFDIKNSSGTTLRTVKGVVTKAGNNLSIGELTNVVVSVASTGGNNIQRTQSYNAFGEIVSETDGRGNVTSYTYNTMGAMVKKTDPTVSITLANGTQTNHAPGTEYIYDAIGRVIAVKDANTNVNTQVWLAGTTSSIAFEKHADGGIKAAGYDIFGNKRAEYDELATTRNFVANASLTATDRAHRIDYTYDNENRLIRIDRQQRGDGTRSYDAYSYDAAGNRISHTTSSDVSTPAKIESTAQTEKTYYDSQGRVIKTISFMDFATEYTYTYVTDVVGVGGATVNGWQKTTKDATLRTLIDKTDMFNHVTWHQDQGGRQFTYVYNQAGWLTSQNGLGNGSQYSGQNIVYSYYNNGNIKAIHDKALGMYTYYEYDKDGNRTFEGYVSLKDAENLAAGAKDYYQYATIQYDAMNRMISVTDPKASISYEYDAVGNRRMSKSDYYDAVNGSIKTQEYWYTYDSMNRFLITMGKLNGARGSGTIDLGVTGTVSTPNNTNAAVSISYNLAGQRREATYGSNNTTEVYSYANDGYLTDVTIGGVIRSSRTIDALGRVLNYIEKNASGTQTYDKATIYDKDSRVTYESGKDGTTEYFYYKTKNDLDGQGKPTYATNGAGALAKVYNDSNGTAAGGTLVSTYYAYEYWDEAKQFAITNQGYDPSLRGNNAFWKPGYSELKYDVNGHLKGANDAGSDARIGTGDDRSFRYVNDAQGLILLRDEIAGGVVNKVQRYYYVNGKRVGDVGSDGFSRTDYAQAMASRGTSKSDYKNWKPVASADFDQNYEPISPIYPGSAPTTYTIKSGDTLQSIASIVWGDASMWYLVADANGLAGDTVLVTGQMLTIPNKLTNIHNNSGTFRVYSPGEAIGDVNPTLPTAPPVPRKKKKGCGGFAQLIVAAVTIAVTVATYGSLGAVASAALGNIAGQVTGNVLGVQKGFDFKSFASSVATAGITDGLLGPATNPSGVIGNAIKNAVGTSYAAIAARAVVGSVINQGVGNITGTQKGFSWSSVAIAGVGATAAAFATNQMGLTKFGAQGDMQPSNTGFGNDLGRAAVEAGSFALTQLAIKGGKINWQQVATDTVTNLIQNRAESNVAKQNGLTTPVYGNTFDEDRRVRSQGLNLANDDNLTAPTSTLRLSDDEVIVNALARQEAKQARSMFEIPASEGGLAARNAASATEVGVKFTSNQYNSLAEYNAKNGGLSSTWLGSSQDNGTAAKMVAVVKQQVNKVSIDGSEFANSNGSNKVRWSQMSSGKTYSGNQEYYDALSNWSSNTQKVASTFDATVDAFGKYKGANAIASTNAKYLPDQIDRIKSIMKSETLSNAQSVIKSSTAKSAIAMAEYADKFEGLTKKLPYLGKALTIAEESKRYNLAQTNEERARVVSVGYSNYLLDNFATSTGVWIGAKGGALSGAAIGSLFPGPGTTIGAVVGGVGGAIYGAYKGHQLYDAEAAPFLREHLVGKKFRD